MRGDVPATRLLLVRHGQTDDNANQVFQGQKGRGLNAVGRAQAARLAERVARLSVDVLITSDLERAAETARIVGARIGLEPTLDRALREVDVGAWTGLTYAEAALRFPEEWAAWTAGLDVPRGGGETYAALAARIGARVRALAEEHAGRTVLAVSHGAALRSFVATLLGLAAQGPRALAGLQNTSITTIGADGGILRLVAFNDAAHLEDGEPWR
jgi:probable phosphoglycerate mutase